MQRKLGLVISLFFVFSAYSANATPITFTGAELAAHEGFSFPNGSHAITGESLFLKNNSGTNSEFQVLGSLSLRSFDVDASNIGFSVNFTHLADDQGGGLAGFYVGIADLSHVFGGYVLDHGRPYEFNPRELEFLNGGKNAANVNFTPTYSEQYPIPIGNSANFDVLIQATLSATTVIGSIEGRAPITFSRNSALDFNNSDLSLVFISGNISNDNYQINSVTFTSGVTASNGPTAISEPGSIVLTGFGGLGLFGFMGWRRRRQ